MVEETHKGRRFAVNLTRGKPNLTIDGEKVEVTQEADGSFSSKHNMFMTFGSLYDLARSLIDQGVGL